MINILFIIIGSAFMIWIPGYLLTKRILKHESTPVKIASSLGLSISISIFLGLSLAWIGIFNKLTFFVGLLIISIGLWKK